jgi:DNA-binding NarL/FixJ family response regulator
MTSPAVAGTMGPMASLLIIDDHDRFRTFARDLLETQGFDVVGEASTGTAGIAEAARLRPDVVLLDVMLPDVDGFTICAAVPGAPIVVMTSSHDVSTFREHLERSRARGFIAKTDLSGESFIALLR